MITGFEQDNKTLGVLHALNITIGKEERPCVETHETVGARKTT